MWLVQRKKKIKTWLLLDGNYLCHRAWHAHGDLHFQDVRTGVIFGFFRDIIYLQDKYPNAQFAFCFDRKPLWRAGDYPGYKKKRIKDKYTEEEIESKKFFDRQVKLLREEYLTQLGYRNVFYQRGYEADDVIASIVNDNSQQLFIIVSADQDLFQLLSPRVTIWNPKTKVLTTEASFSKEFGVTPTQWVDVKAIAGCKTDSIDGVQKGIGPKTAAKFLNGKIVSGSEPFQAIVKGDKIWKRNRYLVRLPYPGVNQFKLIKSHVQAGSWKELARKLGMTSIKDKVPRSKKPEGFGF